MVKLFAFVVAALLCGTCTAAVTDLLPILQTLTEGPLARLLDTYSVPTPKQTGYEKLVPQKDILLLCTKTPTTRLQQVLLSDVNLQNKLNFSLPLTIAIHGWHDVNLTLYSALTPQFLSFTNKTNYCVLDWRPYATFGYQIATRQSTPQVAQYLAGFLQYLAVLYYSLDNVSLIGFSMGGQIAGLTGKLLLGRLGTIYALDPAGPLFSHPIDIGPNRRLAASDAKYVQVIYTSRYTLGFGPLLAGAQNFLPNRGYHPQPSCEVKGEGMDLLVKGLLCSHKYAIQLFVSSLNPANPIIGQKCPTVLGVRVCLFGTITKDRLGIYAKRIPGDFYL